VNDSIYFLDPDFKTRICRGCRSEVLGQFAMVNVELLNLVEDIKPILKMFVVYPKNVNAENATSTFSASLYFHNLHLLALA